MKEQRAKRTRVQPTQPADQAQIQSNYNDFIKVQEQHPFPPLPEDSRLHDLWAAEAEKFLAIQGMRISKRMDMVESVLKETARLRRQHVQQPTPPASQPQQPARPTRQPLPEVQTVLHKSFISGNQSEGLPQITPKDTGIGDKPKRALEAAGVANLTYPRGNEESYFPNTDQPNPPALTEFTPAEQRYLTEIRAAVGETAREAKQELEHLKETQRPSGWKFMARFKAGYRDYKHAKEPLKRFTENLAKLAEYDQELRAGAAPTALTPGGMKAVLNTIEEHAHDTQYKTISLKKLRTGLEGVVENAEGRAKAVQEYNKLNAFLSVVEHGKYLNDTLANNYRRHIEGADQGQKKMSVYETDDMNRRFSVFSSVNERSLSLALPTVESFLNAIKNHEIARQSRVKGRAEYQRIQNFALLNPNDILINNNMLNAYVNTLNYAEQTEGFLDIGQTDREKALKFLRKTTERLPTLENLMTIRNQMIAEAQSQELARQRQDLARQQFAQAQQNAAFVQQARRQQAQTQQMFNAANQANAQMNANLQAQMRFGGGPFGGAPF